MVTERGTSLALDRICVRQEVVETVVSREPLRSGFGTDPGDAGQIVGMFTHQSSQFRIPFRGDEVLLLNGLRGHTLQLGDALLGVENRDLVGDKLHGVPISRDDEGVHVCRAGRGGQSRKNVVGLITGHREMGDVERVENLLDELDLPGKFRRSGCPTTLVVLVLLGAEGTAGEVEGHRYVARILILDEPSEHGDEAVHRVGVLAGARGEVLHRQGEERAKCHRVAVDNQQGGALAHVYDSRR